jgi:5-(carboxyamino)imidazole ribonucleotide synthase
MGPLGILGGGQLGRMTLQAASRLGIDVVIAERFLNSPAARMTSQWVLFPRGWDDPDALDRLSRLAPVVTLESEFVDWRVLDALAQRGVAVRPSPACVGVVQDKLLQKQALARAELPVPAFGEIMDPAHLRSVGDDFGWPLMLKARRDGYDGRGNVVVDGPDAAEQACAHLGWPERQLYAEAFVQFERELASLVVRGLDGQIAEYPVVETIQDAALHVCREVLAPADVASGVAEHAASVARGAVEAVDGLGAFGVEMFLLPDGEVVVNELAPRPHNSAHYTIDACWSSQFDNHVRAVLGLSLAETGMRAPAAVMLNLLGTSDEPVEAAAGLGTPRTFVHLYGKRENRPGRKMGHITTVGDTLVEARRLAINAATRVRV